MREKAPQQLGVRMRRHWLSVALALAIALTCAMSTAFAIPVLPPDLEYSVPRMTPESQGFGLGGFTWSNVAPNALGSYYTYVPLSHADAIALGFNDYVGVDPLNPANTNFTHSCGNLALGETTSTNDCYVITVKRFNQALGLPAAWGFGGPGLLSSVGSATATDVFGYGSGGKNWIPPQFVYDALSPTGIRPKTAQDPGGIVTVAQGNAPTPFFDGGPGSVTNGIWHFPAPTIKGTKGRSIRVQWLNELPNQTQPGFDPTVDCSNNAPDCFPFNRIVTHVHGAHVGPESDGLAHAGYNPDFSNVGTKFNLSVLPASFGPPGTYVYPMDQEAATIWYHDHAVGTTHLNTNQGMAGFFPIADDNEKCLQGIGTVGGQPCAKVVPTGTVADPTKFELGFALQDRVFDINGQFIMPDAPVVDANFPTCDATDAGTRMATCSPLFMNVAHAADAASLTPAGTHQVPYDEATITDTGVGGINENAPFVGVSATLEFFGNMPVVNGVVYAKYDVEPRVYRMRFIGGTDSRTWVMQLQNRANGSIIPFYQIGSEQGFLDSPAPRTEMLLMPGERLDVLVDFGGLAAGAKVVMNNLGTDAPFQGEPIAMMARSVDIPEIMEFNVVTLDGATPDVPSPALISSLRPISGAIVPLTATPNLPIRRVALEEIVDEYGRIMPTIDRRGYDLPGMPATEIIHLNDVEVWDIINTTADAHPMHIHLVAFQIVHREPFDPLTFVPAVNDITNNIFTQPSYTSAGAPVPPDPHDAGWKDTAYSPPGFVTRVIAHYDKAGEYVWHCHILSHEEHDMMRPMKIVSLRANPPQSVNVPASSIGLDALISIVPPTTQVANQGLRYVIEYKLAAATDWTTNVSTSPAAIVTFPGYGVYNVRAKIVDSTVSPTVADSTYVDAVNTLSVDPLDSIVSPVNGATLAGATQQFTLSSASTSDVLWVGKTLGKADIGRFNVPAGQFTVTVNGLPTDGSTVYVRFWVKGTKVDPADPHRVLTVWNYKDYNYVAAPSVVTSLNISTGPLVQYTIGSGVYDAVFVASGGTAPYSFAATAGTVPPGLTVYSNGQLWGVPTTAGTYNFTVTVTDGVAATFNKAFTLVVASNLNIATASPLPQYVLGSGVYDQVISANGGTGPFTYAATAGTVPPGLTVYSNGQLWGVPTTAGTYNFTVTVTDGLAATFNKAFTLVVVSNLNIATASPLPQYVLGSGVYDQVITASGGTGPFTYAATVGTVPPGLTVYSNGQLWGVPTTAGTYNFAVQVTDSTGATFSKVFSLDIL